MDAFLATHTCAVRFISLRRNAGRWAAAAAHAATLDGGSMESDTNAGGKVDVQMFEGTDAHAHKALLASGGLDAVEKELRCRVYRGWPICDEDDVRRILADAGQATGDDGDGAASEAAPTGLELWLAYEGWFKRRWYKRLAQKYCDYFNRHMTLGECGSSLAHLRVAEAAAEAEGAAARDVTVVFEDDSRPVPGVLPVLFAQIDALERRGIAWDLIYIASTKYDRAPEPPAGDEKIAGDAAAACVDAGADAASLPPLILVKAGHRKVCAAYALSRRGARKIATSGYRECLFPIDDFLPALHSTHPRVDVMVLDCVLKARGGDGGFAAFAFPDNSLAPLRADATNGKLVSDNNCSPCVLGDHGFETELVE